MEIGVKQSTTADDRMEHRIDAALRAVGHATPSVGMAERITLRLQSAAVDRTASRFPWQRMLVPAFGCAAVAVFIVLGLRIHVTQRIAGSAALAGNMQPALSTAVAPKESREVRRVEAGNPGKPLRVKMASHTGHRARHVYPDNYPLTHQERLLVQLVRTVDPKDLQILNPEYRAAQEAKEDAEFEAYVKSTETAATTTKTEKTNDTQTTEDGTTL